MAGKEFFVGIDVHERSWTACVLQSDRKEPQFIMINSFDSLHEAAEKLHDKLKGYVQGREFHSCYENGSWAFSVHHILQDLGWNNIVVSGNSIPRISKDRHQKNDKQDSHNLAYYLSIGKLNGSYIPSKDEELLKALVLERKMLIRE